jgi:hypothetical protein
MNQPPKGDLNIGQITFVPKAKPYRVIGQIFFKIIDFFFGGGRGNNVQNKHK